MTKREREENENIHEFMLDLLAEGIVSRTDDTWTLIPERERSPRAQRGWARLELAQFNWTDAAVGYQQG